MVVCKSLRDKIAFKLIRFGFRIALKHRTENKYLKYRFGNDEYSFVSKGDTLFQRLFKVKCSNCETAFTFQPGYNYCPYCGATDMSKEGAEE